MRFENIIQIDLIPGDFGCCGDMILKKKEDGKSYIDFRYRSFSSERYEINLKYVRDLLDDQNIEYIYHTDRITLDKESPFYNTYYSWYEFKNPIAIDIPEKDIKSFQHIR